MTREPDYADTRDPAHMSDEQRRQHGEALNAKTGPIPPPGHPGSPFAIARRPIVYDENGIEC